MGLLAFYSLIKFTVLINVLWAVGAITLVAILDTRRWQALLPSVVYAAFALLLWTAVGQSPLNIPSYIRASLTMSSGYSAAMGYSQSNSSLLPSLIVLALGTLTCVVLSLTPRSKPFMRVFSIYVLLSLWLQWKHGFVRDDNYHVIHFLTYATMFPMIMATIVDGQGHFCRPVLPLMFLITFFTCANILEREPGLISLRRAPTECRKVIRGNYRALGNLESHRQALTRGRDAAIQECSLPTIKRYVGNHAIDVISLDQAALLLNGLTWAPRPVFQSYAAYNHSLAKANLDFYNGPRAPRFVLFHLYPIDGRLPTLDDGAILTKLIEQYQFVCREGAFILLERRAVATCDAPGALTAASGTAMLGQSIEIPKHPGCFTTLSVKMKRRWPGALLTALYRAPHSCIQVILDDGSAMDYRFLPDMARLEIPLDPLLRSTDEFQNFLITGQGPRVASVRIDCSQTLGIAEYEAEFEYALAHRRMPPRPCSSR